MKSCKIYPPHVLAYILGAVCLVTVFSLPAISDTPPGHTPPFGGAEMVPLRNDRLLLWEKSYEENGRVQIREQNGTWSPVFRLPFNTILKKIKPDGEGFLALGGFKSELGKFPVVALNASGQEIDRWPVDYVWRVYSDASGRWAVTETGLIPLLPQGALGKEIPFPAGDSNPTLPSRFPPGNLVAVSRFPPHIFHRQGANVFCHDTDWSMQYFAHASCERPEPGGWYHDAGEYTSSELNVACGPWLIINEEKKPYSGELIVLDMATGRTLSHRRYSHTPSFACVDEDELAVGSNRLELLQLPLLKPRWQSPVLPGRVAQLVVMEHYFAYKFENKGEILLLPRPAPP